MLELDNGLSFPEAQVRGHEPRTGPYVASASKKRQLNTLAPPFGDAAARTCRTCAVGIMYNTAINPTEAPPHGSLFSPASFFELVVGRSR